MDHYEYNGHTYWLQGDRRHGDKRDLSVVGLLPAPLLTDVSYLSRGNKYIKLILSSHFIKIWIEINISVLSFD